MKVHRSGVWTAAKGHWVWHNGAWVKFGPDPVVPAFPAQFWVKGHYEYFLCGELVTATFIEYRPGQMRAYQASYDGMNSVNAIERWSWFCEDKTGRLHESMYQGGLWILGPFTRDRLF